MIVTHNRKGQALAFAREDFYPITGGNTPPDASYGNSHLSAGLPQTSLVALTQTKKELVVLPSGKRVGGPLSSRTKPIGRGKW
jgi:hypothetical protein